MGTKEEGSMLYLQVGGVSERKIKIVPAPPRGERNCGRNEIVEEGTVILGKENEKGKRK